ncbi:MAG: ArsR family transcriptional regulator [Candidatus Hodarchaeales archaeon]|jgi:predicted transcriptional regulator
MVTLSEIIHPTRLKVLNLLVGGSQTLADIAKSLDLSKPEISRHLARMRELNLVEKEDKNHLLTSFGGIFLNLTSPIEFIITNYDYFMNHTVDLPFSFIRDIDSLKNSELVSGAGYFISKIEELRKITTNNAKMMVDQPFPMSSDHVEEALLIVPSYAKSENLNEEQLKKTCTYYEVKTLPVISTTLGIVDKKYGFLLFPEKITSKIDYNHAFFVTDEMGLEFLLRLWDYYWERAESRMSSHQK